MDIKTFVDSDWYFGNNLLHLAVKSKNPMLVKEVLKFGVNIHQLGYDGKTALFDFESNEILKILLNAGIDPNIQNSNTGETVLFRCKDLEAVKLLLMAGIDPNITNGPSSNVHPKSIIMNKKGWNALCYRCYWLGGQDHDIDLKIVNVLIPLTDLDYDNCEVLRVLIGKRTTDLNLVKNIISRIKNFNSVNADGDSLLHEAARKRDYWDVIELLIDSGVDLHIENNNGNDFYDLCYKNIQKRIVEKLPDFLEDKAIRKNVNKYNL